MIKLLNLMIGVMIATSTFAQTENDCPCCKDDYSAFDFWVGEWDVYDLEGNVLGYSRIEKSDRNCILFEKWTSKESHTGSSINYFDLKNYEWNQVWVDNNGLILKLKGGLIASGIMQMTGDATHSENGFYFKNSIRWTLQDDGSIRQEWNITEDDLTIIKTLFVGIYKKK